MEEPDSALDGAATVVHVVAKTHLDLGFTALASEVEERYLTELFPRALATAAALRQRGGPERLVWTTGSWILHRALHDPDPVRARAVAEGVQRGDLAWHALAVTTHTELMDAALMETNLSISSELDALVGRAGSQRSTVAAKLTDVPGHTRAMVAPLAAAGVTFLHIGVNPAWPVPDVPPVFRWKDPDGAEVVVAYQAGGYGGIVDVPGCDHVLAFLHTGDNQGPPTPTQVLEAHQGLRHRFPGAEVRASTLSDFARALTGSGAVDGLPVVTAEIGDPWLFGTASDPAKLARFRHLLRRRTRLRAQGTDLDPEVDRTLLLVTEHTWGLDQKEALPDTTHWDRAGLAQLRSTAAAQRFESSWAEQRAYLDRVENSLVTIDALPSDDGASADGTSEPGTRSDVRTSSAPSPSRRQSYPLNDRASFPQVLEDRGFLAVNPHDPVTLDGWTLSIDPRDGSLTGLTNTASGRCLADRQHRLGLLSYQSFDDHDYQRFYAGLAPTPADEWWARWDNTKPGIDRVPQARSGRWSPVVADIWALPGREVVVRVVFETDLHTDLGAPDRAWIRWWAESGDSRDHDSGGGPAVLHAELIWVDKPANRLPEALWWSFNPVVAVPQNWTIDKLGREISPLDVVAHGGRSLHAVGEGGLRYRGPDGALKLDSADASLVAPGQPNLLDANPPTPDMAGGWHLLLANNCWGTNFPMWIEGPGRFRVTISADDQRGAGPELGQKSSSKATSPVTPT